MDASLATTPLYSALDSAVQRSGGVDLDSTVNGEIARGMTAAAV
jgi:hypothetical protein